MTPGARGESDFLWDIEWVNADGTPLEEKRGVNRKIAELQAQVWFQEHPGSRVSLYRRRGETSVLVRVWNAG